MSESIEYSPQIENSETEPKKEKIVVKVYHGTTLDFENHKRSDRGIWFTDLPEEANRFTQFGTGENPNIRPSRISIENPLEIDYNGKHFEPNDAKKWITQAHEGHNDGIIVRNLRNYSNSPLSTSYIVFDPNQVESVFSPPK